MIEELFKVYKITKKTVWEVSNLGNVKKNGEVYECGINPISGYKIFSGVYLHKAVAELFIENPEKKHHVDHIDTNRLNNNVTNLRWCTHKENCNNPLTKTHQRESRIGKTQSFETKQKISKATVGVWINRKDQSKPVLQFTKYGMFVAEYPSTYEAQRQTGIFRQSISKCCDSKNKSAGGFVWKWKEAN